MAGDGHDVVDDSASGGTDVWHDGESVEVKRGDGTKVRTFRWVNPDPVDGAPWIEPRSSGHFSIGAVTFGYRPGAIIGYEVTRTAWGFRTKNDASSVQTVRGSIGIMDQSLPADYVGRFRPTGSRISFQIETAAIETRRSNFFGFGNDTANPEDRSRFSTQQTIFFASPSLRWEHGHRTELYAASEFQYSNARLPEASYLKKIHPTGVGNFGTLELKTGFRFDSRNAAEASAPSDLAAASQFGEITETVTGIRAEGNAFVAPKFWDVKKPYQGGEGSVTGYLGNSRAHLALRVGGRSVSGDYPWYESAFIGSHNNRGYYSHRFRGDRSLYANASLRLWTGAVPIIVPVRIGLVGFADTGRVWMSGETSTVWHNSTGGGLMFRPLATATTLYAVVAHSKEGNRFYFGFGFPL